MGYPAVKSPGDRDALIESESFALRHAVLSARRIVTHQNADLDALLSVALCQIIREIEGKGQASVLFIAGGEKKLGEGDLGVDFGIARGLRSMGQGLAIKASEAGGAACKALWRLLPEDEKYILHFLIDEISLDDSSDEGTVERLESRLGIKIDREEKNRLRCIGLKAAFQAWRMVKTDWDLYGMFFDLVRGILKQGRHRLRMKREIGDIWDGVALFFGRRLAVLPVGASIFHARQLEKHGVEITMHCREFEAGRWSLGIHRANGVALEMQKLFNSRLDDFPDIYVADHFIGWGEKGGGLRCDEVEVRRIRSSLIGRVKEVLEPWFSASRH